MRARVPEDSATQRLASWPGIIRVTVAVGLSRRSARTEIAPLVVIRATAAPGMLARLLVAGGTNENQISPSLAVPRLLMVVDGEAMVVTLPELSILLMPPRPRNQMLPSDPAVSWALLRSIGAPLVGAGSVWKVTTPWGVASPSR